MQDKLKEQGVVASKTTLKAHLRAWDIVVATAAFADSAELRNRVRELYSLAKCNDAQATAVLQDEGYNIGQRRLQRLRLEMGLKKRIVPEVQEEHNQRMAGVARGIYWQYCDTHGPQPAVHTCP